MAAYERSRIKTKVCTVLTRLHRLQEIIDFVWFVKDFDIILLRRLIFTYWERYFTDIFKILAKPEKMNKMDPSTNKNWKASQ